MFEPLVEAELIPGAIVGIYEKGKTSVYTVGHLAPKDTREPDQDTVYEIGSISKVFTGILLAQAVQNGEVKLDDPLSKYLPAGIAAPALDGQEVLIWHLTTHTSGLPRMPENMGDVDLNNPFAKFGKDALWENIDGCELITEPGEEYAYSNLAVGLLGTIPR